MSGDSSAPLAALQRWMQAVITHPAGVIAGAASGEARGALETSATIDTLIERSVSLSATERIEIYQRAYFARLLECLREEYSVLAMALGEELFDAFALHYLQRYPSESYTLGRLGERFPDYLAETRPGDAGRGGENGEPDWPEFLIDLARLERAINEVFDGPGAEELSPLDPARLAAIPADQWPEARLVCVPCLKLLALRYQVNGYFTHVRKGEEPSLPERSPALLAVTRRNYRVVREPLSEPQFALLSALQSGETVGQAIDRASRISTASAERFAEDLREWFRSWTAAGLFSDVRVEASS